VIWDGNWIGLNGRKYSLNLICSHVFVNEIRFCYSRFQIFELYHIFENWISCLRSTISSYIMLIILHFLSFRPMLFLASDRASMILRDLTFPLRWRLKTSTSISCVFPYSICAFTQQISIVRISQKLFHSIQVHPDFPSKWRILSVGDES
jgi:hypothetical protein